MLHAFPSTFLLYGLPFYTTVRLGWKTGPNLLMQALSGLCIAIGSYLGGQISHRAVPRRAIAFGLTGALIASLIGFTGSRYGVMAFVLPVMVALFSFAQSMLWPGIEAALMEGEPPAQVQHFVSYYNLTWSLGTATAFLLATPLMTALGINVVFLLPAACYAVNLLLLGLTLPRRQRLASVAEAAGNGDIPREEREHGPLLTPAQRAAFRSLGWVGNPLAYVAINVIVAYNPTLQARLGLRFGSASVWFSLWFYVRMAAFELLRRWNWWHYRWRFLCGGFALMMASFAALLLAPSLPVLIGAQIVFGLCIGLLYQSSLFYSMAGSEAQGEHGGFHESFIGLGIMIGPLLAYGGTTLAPTRPGFAVAFVLTLMSVGLVAMSLIGKRTGQ